MRASLVNNDTILVRGYVRDTLPPFPQTIVFARIDTFGEVIDQENFVDPNGRTLSITPLSKITTTQSGGYLATGMTFQDNAQLIIRLDHHFKVDTVYEFLSNDTTVLINFSSAVYEITDGYLVFGYAQETYFDISPQVVKLSTEGNILWRRRYGLDNVDEFPNDFIRYNDSTFLVGCGRGEATDPDGPIQDWLFAVDLEGNLVDEYFDDRPYSGAIGGLDLDESGAIYFAGLESFIDMFGFRVNLGKVTKLNSDLEKQWTRLWNGGNREATTLTGIVLDNDNVFAVGMHIDTFTNMDGFSRYFGAGWTVTASVSGDSVCSRVDTSYWHEFNGPFGRFYQVHRLSGGTIIALGEGNFASGSETALRAWLVKMPKPPCIGITTSIDQPSNHERSIVVAPNPFSDYVDVSIPKHWRSGTLHVTSVSGKTYYTSQLSSLDNQYRISTADFPPGVFVCTVTSSDGKNVSSAKVVKMR
ncbi:MAG: T9SS type A sorting domain-containing protein [Saprospiraceae bacterium]|nr:T9SS type A sorting domain-containing protein [Saprospiraceae bacterium]